MSFTTEKKLEALLQALEGVVEPMKKRGRYIGDAKNNVAFGNNQANAADGKRGNDVIFGKGGADRLSGADGNDSLFGGDDKDLLVGGSGDDTLFGDSGDDFLDGSTGIDTLFGGTGVDALLGGEGDDTLVGGDGVDTLVGGTGRDRFLYTGNVFANGTPALVAAPNIRVLAQPDIIRDYTVGQDQIALDGQALKMDSLVFQKGAANQLDDGGNVLVLTTPFAAAGAAARAIANNTGITTTKEGIFVYFNTTLGLTRVVYSKDLANGGDISILANLDNQRGAAGQANIANFSAADFSLV
jgi:serralysin